MCGSVHCDICSFKQHHKTHAHVWRLPEAAGHEHHQMTSDFFALGPQSCSDQGRESGRQRCRRDARSSTEPGVPPSTKLSLRGFISQVLLSSISLKTSKPSNHQWLFQNAMCYSLALIKYFCHGAFEVLWTHWNKCAGLMWSCLSLKRPSPCLRWSCSAHLHVDFRSCVPLPYPLVIPFLPTQTWMCIRIQARDVRIHFSSTSST